jgi:hypothetical protein
VKLDTTVAEQISAWKAKQTFEGGTAHHVCSGQRCSYHRIGDVFLCERTGNIHGELVLMVQRLDNES